MLKKCKAGAGRVGRPSLAQTRPNSLPLLSLLDGLTLSLARSPDGHGTRDVGLGPPEQKAETQPARRLESGHQSHSSSRVEVEMHHWTLRGSSGAEKCW